MLTTRTRGFTLIEVAVVLVVLAILAAIAIPTFNTFMNRTDQNTAQESVNAFVRNMESRSALDGTIYPLTLADAEAVDQESTGAMAPVIDSYNSGVLTVIVQGTRGPWTFEVDMSNGSVTDAAAPAPVAAAAFTEAPNAPRTAANWAAKDPSVLGIELVKLDGNDAMWAEFDTTEYDQIRYATPTGTGSWNPWQQVAASGEVYWPTTAPGGPPYSFWPNYVIAFQASNDGGNTWSELRYVLLQLSNEAAGNQPTLTVADKNLWNIVKAAFPMFNLTNHPDDTYVY